MERSRQSKKQSVECGTFYTRGSSQMDFLEVLKMAPFMLYDGPMETRIQFASNFKLDKEMSIFTLLNDKAGQNALRKLYKTDISVTEPYDAPIILNAPTFRASPSHVSRLGFNPDRDIEKINHDAIQFVKAIRAESGAYADKIFITAPIGPKNAGYSPNLNFTIDDAIAYHTPQTQAIAQAGVDVISIAAMPGLIETIGCARVVSRTGLPYSVGVILNHEGTLLDGNPLSELIQQIDNNIFPQPNFYIISCTHPAVAQMVLQNHDECYKRILGIKANGSAKKPQELLQLDHAEADEPALFADELIALGEAYHFKIYGGCCGTDDRHLQALVAKLSAKFEKN